MERPIEKKQPENAGIKLAARESERICETIDGHCTESWARYLVWTFAPEGHDVDPLIIEELFMKTSCNIEMSGWMTDDRQNC